jgi:type I restriction-modification system DNA methylase subunit
MSEDKRGEALGEMSNDELAELVRNTAAFRAAASCATFAEEAQELRENDSLAFDRLVRETHERQGTGVSSRETTRGIINTFIDTVEEHAELADKPADAAENAASEVVVEDG